MRKGILIVVALLALGFSSNSQAQTGERALYLSGNHTLQGVIFRPQGTGPFPVVVFSQQLTTQINQSQAPNPYPQLAKLFVSKGYIFFVPGRHNTIHGTANKKGDASETLRPHEEHAKNLIAAVTWIKAQHDVDEDRVCVLGEAAGGISTLFAINEGLAVRALVLFSPGAQFMKTSSELRAKLTEAVQSAAAPIFLIQTENDYSQLPKTIFGPILEGKGNYNRTKVYPAYGETLNDAIHFAANGHGVWQRDVLAFLNSAMN